MVNNMNESWIVKPKESKPVPIKLDMYNQPETFYKSANPVYGDKYKVITENSHGKAIKVENGNINEGKNIVIVSQPKIIT